MIETLCTRIKTGAGQCVTLDKFSHCAAVDSDALTAQYTVTVGRQKTDLKLKLGEIHWIHVKFYLFFYIMNTKRLFSVYGLHLASWLLLKGSVHSSADEILSPVTSGELVCRPFCFICAETDPDGITCMFERA